MINWNEILAQLDWDDATRQERALQSRLKERARQYAQPKQAEQDIQQDVYHVLTFHLGGERYAVEVKAVRGVRSVERITRVPSTPPFYRGVVNVRGQILSVLELRAFFNVPYDMSHTPKEMITIEASGLTLALLADHVNDVISIIKSDVESVDLRYAFGVTRTRLTILDVEQIVADDRLIIGGRNHE
jgi:purine-binding chemotaxis protein CheW